MALLLLLACSGSKTGESDAPAMCDVPVVATCHDEEPRENSGGAIAITWLGDGLSLVVGEALRTGCETADLTIEATGRASTDSLIATFALGLAGGALTVNDAEIQVYPGSSSGGDLYTYAWTDTGGQAQTTDLHFDLEREDGWSLVGVLGGSLRGSGGVEGTLVDLSGSFDLRTNSTTVEGPCPESRAGRG